jgi:DNA repair protein RecN (Recombination protein N)
MLLSIHLRDFVIVEQLDVEFGPGFNVLSGETGAGKSILIDALGLALGGRADASVVREGSARSEINAVFAADAPLTAWLNAHELGGDEGQVQLRRVVDAEGKSRAYINGSLSTAALQREVGERLLDVHGQHANQSLLKPEGQRALLDTFAGLAPKVQALRAAWQAWAQGLEQLERATTQGRQLSLERERVQWQLQDLETLKPQPGEWEQLVLEQKRVEHAQSLVQGASLAADALTESDDAIVATLQKLSARLASLATIDTRLAPTVAMLEQATIELDEVANNLSDYAQASDLDPQRAAQIEERVSSLHAVARKLKIQGAQLPSLYQELTAQLVSLDQAQDLAALQAHCDTLGKQYQTLAQEISSLRKKAAKTLAQGISQTIQALGMPGGKVELGFTPQAPGPNGLETVEFLVQAHGSASARALSKVASGGELSRVSLGIAVAAATANPTPTIIFDEADAGVGGAVAEKIGQLMRALGDSRQVLTVTHLPQVAALGHQHYAVTKTPTAKGKAVTSQVKRLDRAARVEEIARMLGGVEITATTRKHAQELLTK